MSNKMSALFALGLFVTGAVASVPALAQGVSTSPFDLRAGGTFVPQRDLIKEGRSAATGTRVSVLGLNGAFVATDLSPAFDLQPGGTFETQAALRAH